MTLAPSPLRGIQEITGLARCAGIQPPPELFFAYRRPDRDVYVYAPWGLHFLLRWWYLYRWQPVRWLIRRGVLTLDEGGYYRDARLAPLSQWFRGRIR